MFTNILRRGVMFSALLWLISAMAMAGATLDEVDYTPQDSLRVVELLAEAYDDEPQNVVLFFARKFIGVPYVAKTLDRDAMRERLVVNLREMDCTTFVETSVALARTFYNKKRSFGDFVEELTALRYKQGRVAYESRNHYFTGWILSNSACGAVMERPLDGLAFANRQRVEVNYMSRHADFYPQLKANPTTLLPKIRTMETGLNGLICRYIPKSKLNDSASLKEIVGDGDIIAITTSKSGLDCSHIGFAIWHSDGLHLLNASQIHGRVVDETMTLYDYMRRHPSQTGIRVVEVKR